MNRTLNYLKLFYLYLTYWFVGLDEEGFHWKKGDLLAELGYFHQAIYSLNKAKNDLKTYYVLGSLGCCYLQIEDYERALLAYREAYQQAATPEVIWGLAVSELETGNLQESKRLYTDLKPFRDSPGMERCISYLEEGYANRK